MESFAIVWKGLDSREMHTLIYNIQIVFLDNNEACISKNKWVFLTQGNFLTTKSFSIVLIPKIKIGILKFLSELYFYPCI